MNSEGRSSKGGGLRVGGLWGGGFGGADMSSGNFRGTAIGEATERAVTNLAEKIVSEQDHALKAVKPTPLDPSVSPRIN